MYACFLAITFHLGYKEDILCFYGHNVLIVYAHHCFICMMVGNFAMEIRAKRRAKKISEALHKAIEKAERFHKNNEHFKNQVKNN